MLKRILLGLPFYGSGNIGDDLMLRGFLWGLDRLGLRSGIQLDALSDFCGNYLNIAFPEVRWRKFDSAIKAEAVDIWAGVGDTPLQSQSESWLLPRFEAIMRHMLAADRKVLINVGMEGQPGDFLRYQPMISLCDTVSARDMFSLKLFRDEFGCTATRATILGGDMAILALLHDDSFGVRYQENLRNSTIGIGLGSVRLSQSEVNDIRDFCRDKTCVFLVNEVRYGQSTEKYNYSRCFPWLKRLIEAALLRYHAKVLGKIAGGLFSIPTRNVQR